MPRKKLKPEDYPPPEGYTPRPTQPGVDILVYRNTGTTWAVKRKGNISATNVVATKTEAMKIARKYARASGSKVIVTD